jgi:hypothetical protein
MRVKIVPNDTNNPAGKLADAELHFEDGPLAGLKLIGFGIWERRTSAGRNVTFPARAYTLNGERRSFALLRPITDPYAQERIRDLILEAYAAQEAAEQFRYALQQVLEDVTDLPGDIGTMGHLTGKL